MNPQNIRLYKAVKIVWEDSAHVDGWKHGEMVHADVGTITSIGFVIETSPAAVAISSSLSDQNACICPLSIPWRSMKECVEIETIQ